MSKLCLHRLPSALQQDLEHAEDGKLELQIQRFEATLFGEEPCWLEEDAAESLVAGSSQPRSHSSPHVAAALRALGARTSQRHGLPPLQAQGSSGSDASSLDITGPSVPVECSHRANNPRQTTCMPSRMPSDGHKSLAQPADEARRGEEVLAIHGLPQEMSPVQPHSWDGTTITAKDVASASGGAGAVQAVEEVSHAS